MLLRAGDEQERPEDRPAREVEGTLVLRRLQPRHLRPGAPAAGTPARSTTGNGKGAAGRTRWDGSTPSAREDGAQRLVAADELVQAAAEDRDRERPRDLDAVEQVVDRRPRIELVEEPHPLLGEGERRGLGGGGAPPRDARRGELPGAGGRRAGDAHGVAQHRRRLLDRGGDEQRLERQLGPEGVAQPRGDLGGEQRVPPELVEVVLGPHLGDAEHLLPDVGDLPLVEVAGGDVARAQGRPLLARRGGRRQHGRDGGGRHGGACPDGGDRRRGVDPVAATLERIGRQRHPAAPLAGVEALPVDPRAGDPEPADGAEQDREVGAGVLGLAHGGDHRPLVGRGEVPANQRRQPRAGTDLQQRHPGLAGAQRLDAVREAHRLAQVARPVGGIGRLGGVDPGARAARHEGDLRRPRAHRGDPRLVGGHGRLGLRRVAGEGDLEGHRHHPLGGEPRR